MCPGKLSPFSSHHCCLLAACSHVHTPRGMHLPMGTCIHNSFPPPEEKLYNSKVGTETTITFLEIVLSPKSGDDLLGKSQFKPINSMIFSGGKSISEICYLLLVSSEYVLSLRALKNFMEKMVIRRMVKISRCPEQVFTLGNLIMLTIVKDGKLVSPLFWLIQTP